MREDYKLLIFGGVILLTLLYLNYFGLPEQFTLVTECTNNEPTNISDILNLGNYSYMDLSDCVNNLGGNYYTTKQERVIYRESALLIINETYNETKTIYRWCHDDHVITTEYSDLVDKYFDTYFQCSQVDRCNTNADCDSNLFCENALCKPIECPSQASNATTNATIYQKIIDHTCRTVGCLENANCVMSRDTDCNGENEQVNGTCSANQCTYPAEAQVECSQWQIFNNKYKYWIYGGLGAILVGIVIYFRKK